MEAPNDTILWITLVVMLVGLAGSVLPGLPGVPLIFISGLVYAFATGFEYVSGLTVVLLGLFAATALILDFVATAYGARRFGAIVRRSHPASSVISSRLRKLAPMTSVL